jgi:hypothetical protein
VGPVSNFLGGGPKRKKIPKAGPTLFLACGENIFPHGKFFFGILRVTAKFFVKSENIFPPRRKKVGKILRVTAT